MNERLRKKLEIPKRQDALLVAELWQYQFRVHSPYDGNRAAGNASTRCPKLLLCGFGVGLSWASAAITTRDLHVSELIEVADQCPMIDLRNRAIMIAGASSGIGRQCAITCSQLGASLALVGRDPSRLAETRGLLHGRRSLHRRTGRHRLCSARPDGGKGRRYDRTAFGLRAFSGDLPPAAAEADAP